jgi:hypothetical protein
MRTAVYIVGDGAEYDIEFGEEYNLKLLWLINEHLKSEGKAIIKYVSLDDGWGEFQVAMGRLMVKSRQRLTNNSEDISLKLYFEGEHYPSKWSESQPIVIDDSNRHDAEETE